MSKRKRNEIFSYIRNIVVLVLLFSAAIFYITSTQKKLSEYKDQIFQLEEESIFQTEQYLNDLKIIATIKARYDIGVCPICNSDTNIECAGKNFRIYCPNCTLHTEYVETLEKAATLWEIIKEAE